MYEYKKDSRKGTTINTAPESQTAIQITCMWIIPGVGWYSGCPLPSCHKGHNHGQNFPLFYWKAGHEEQVLLLTPLLPIFVMDDRDVILSYSSFSPPQMGWSLEKEHRCKCHPCFWGEKQWVLAAVVMVWGVYTVEEEVNTRKSFEDFISVPLLEKASIKIF